MQSSNQDQAIRDNNKIFYFLKSILFKFFGVLMLLGAIVIWLSLILFEIKDFGSPYASGSLEDFPLMALVGSWINGFINYWLGLCSWLLPLFPLAWGLKIIFKEPINWAFIKILFLFLSIILICGGLKNIGKDSGSTGLILDDILIKIKNLLPENLYYLNINLFSIIIGLILFIICLSIRFKIYKRLLDLKISFLGSLFSLFLFLISPVVNFVKNYNASKKEFAPKKTSKSISPFKKLSKGTREDKEKQVELNLASEDTNFYSLPRIELLNEMQSNKNMRDSEENKENTARMLENVLDDFGVRGEIGRSQAGPVVTRYELEPAPGIRSSRVIGLSDDISRSMSAISARVAVVPGKNAIGIELPNEYRETVYLRELIASKTFEKTYELPLVLGRDIEGNPVVTDLGKMPHLLIAGTTGSGKSVAVNAMILSLLYKLTPQNLKFIMIDPKMLELSVYENIPHLLHPVVTEPRKAIIALKWTVKEMNDRYRLMSQLGVRNINSYNEQINKAKKKGQILTKTLHTGFNPETGKPNIEKHEIEADFLPNIVVVIDEMADLMLSSGREIEMSIQSLAQKARAAGIHLIVATQRPSVDVITGTIKANLPTRISFQVTSKIDSRTILGEQGAEQLLGRGDMLFMESASQIKRVHGPFVSDSEVEKVANFLRNTGTPEYMFEITEEPDEDLTENEKDRDPLFSEAINLIKNEQKVSTSFLQRHLQIGYNRAARIIDKLEAENIISPANHAGKREILIE